MLKALSSSRCHLLSLSQGDPALRLGHLSILSPLHSILTLTPDGM